LVRPNTTRPWVFDADIEGASNNIGHAALVQALGNFPAWGLIKQWLKAGYVEDAMLHPTGTGVPQGGVISPLLLKVALHGMEQALGSSYTPPGTLRGTSALVRYANDLAVLCPTKQAAIDAQDILATWLGTRGLRLSEEKTHIRHLTEGFDFLGFNIRHYPAPQSSCSGYKLLIKPSQGAIQQIRRKLKALWRQHVGSPTVALINAMNPPIRGWSQYFRTGVASLVFSDLDTFMFARAQRYMQRRHPRQSGWWRTQKYWGRTVGSSWIQSAMPPSGNSPGHGLCGIGSPPDLFPRRPDPPGLLETTAEQTPSPGGSPAATHESAARSVSRLSPTARKRRGPARASWTSQETWGHERPRESAAGARQLPSPDSQH